MLGGFLVVRPSMERFEEFRSIIRKGDHTGRGWGGSGIGRLTIDKPFQSNNIFF